MTFGCKTLTFHPETAAQGLLAVLLISLTFFFTSMLNFLKNFSSYYNMITRAHSHGAVRMKWRPGVDPRAFSLTQRATLQQG